MSSSAVSILDRLLDEESVSSKEHTLETASPRIANVQDRFSHTFDEIVKEISVSWGRPTFNNSVAGDTASNAEEMLAGEGDRKPLANVVPSWSNGKPKNGGECKAVRLCYWKRNDAINYVVFRIESEKASSKPMNYELVLGARRRDREAQTRSMDKIRGQKEHWLTGVLNFLLGRA